MSAFNAVGRSKAVLRSRVDQPTGIAAQANRLEDLSAVAVVRGGDWLRPVVPQDQACSSQLLHAIPQPLKGSKA